MKALLDAIAGENATTGVRLTIAGIFVIWALVALGVIR